MPPDRTWFQKRPRGASRMQENLLAAGSAPDPAGGAYSVPPDPIAGGEDASFPYPRIPPPLSVV